VARGLLGSVQAAQMHAAAAAAACGDFTAARADAAAVWARADAVMPTLRPRAEVFGCVAAALAAALTATAAEPAAPAAAVPDARTVLATALDWLHETAAARVPPEFASGFLQRAPGVAALRALAAAQGVPTPAPRPGPAPA
jgi:hypothetical protein